VFPPDCRSQITNTTSFPWRMVAHLYINFPSGSGGCSGWFVGPHTVITAGHCVYNSSHGGWANYVTVSPGRNGSVKPYGSQTSDNLWSVAGWVFDGNSDYDYGAIILPNDNLGDQVGWFTHHVFSDSQVGWTANLVGYPGDKSYGTLWTCAGPIQSATTHKLFYPIDTYGGQSGSPVWIYYSAAPNIRAGIAVHAYGTCGSGVNCGPRITGSVSSNFQYWGAGPPNNSCYTLSKTISGCGSLKIEPPNSDGCPDNKYSPGTVVELTANACTGWDWDRWSGTNNNYVNPTTVTMNGNRSVTAYFIQPPTITPTYTPTKTATKTATPTRTPTATPTIPGQQAIVRIGSGQAPHCSVATVPLEILQPPVPVGAATIDIVYNPAIADPTGWDGGPGWDMVQCSLDYTPHTVRCTAISATGVPGNSLVADITFHCVGDPGQCSALDVSVVTFTDPEGDPIPVTDQDGQFCCTDGVRARIDSADVPPGQTESVGLEALEVPAPGLGSYIVDVHYDPSIVEPVGCDPDPGNVMFSSFCNTDYAPGVVRCGGFQPSEGLTGQVALCDFIFLAVGEICQTSDLLLGVEEFYLTDGTGPAGRHRGRQYPRGRCLRGRGLQWLGPDEGRDDDRSVRYGPALWRRRLRRSGTRPVHLPARR